MNSRGHSNMSKAVASVMGVGIGVRGRGSIGHSGGKARIGDKLKFREGKYVRINVEAESLKPYIRSQLFTFAEKTAKVIATQEDEHESEGWQAN